MNEFIYPSNLYDLVKSRWSKISHTGEELLPMPDEDDFNEILNVVYHASFLTEERRRIWFRVTYLSPEALEKGSVVNADDIRTIKFDNPRIFGVSELSKLAPAADPTQVLIAVFSFGTELKIWGLLETGTEWWDLGRHEASHARTPPNTFTVSSKSPGQVTVSRSGEIIITLNQGKIVESSAAVLVQGPVADFLKAGAQKLQREFLRRLKEEEGDLNKESDFSDFKYITFFERILNRIREKFHGGTLIIIPDEISTDDVRFKDSFIIKYPCQHSSLDILADEQVQDDLLNGLLSKLTFDNEISYDEFSEYRSREWKLEEAQEGVKRAAWFISSLSAVDGAVIITDSLRLIGFGVEITAVSPNLKTVKVITDFTTNVGEIRSIEHFGTRHRSAFRFCSNVENSVAFIVSQDGEIRVTKRVGSELLVWSNINVTSSGF